MKSGNPQLIRQYNQDTIKNLIFEKGPITKTMIANLTSLSVPTVNKIVDDLEASGLVCQDAEIEGNIGRKAKSYKINKDAENFIVFFFLRGCFNAMLTDYFGNKIAEKKIEIFDSKSSFKESFGAVCQAIDEFLKIRPIEKISAIGLGIPGIVNEAGVVSQIPSIPSWDGIILKDQLSERYPVPVYVENDVKLMTVGYFHKELISRYENMVLLYISEGLGAGIIINRKLYKGFKCFAGEYGYMLIDGSYTQKTLSSYGSLEITLKRYVEKFEKGQILTEAEKDEYYNLIAAIITNFSVVLNPEAIAIRGSAVDREAIGLIREKVERMIPKVCVPEMVLLTNDDYGFNGVINFCQASVTSKISVVDQKGI